MHIPWSVSKNWFWYIYHIYTYLYAMFFTPAHTMCCDMFFVLYHVNVVYYFGKVQIPRPKLFSVMPLLGVFWLTCHLKLHELLSFFHRLWSSMVWCLYRTYYLKPERYSFENSGYGKRVYDIKVLSTKFYTQTLHIGHFHDS